MSMRSTWRERRLERARGFIPVEYLNCPILKLISMVKVRRGSMSIKDAEVILVEREYRQRTL